MSKSEARLSAKKAMINGYKHHDYNSEQSSLINYFKGGKMPLESQLSLISYEDVLAPERWRALKNSVICFITVASRTAINCGLNSEYSFALSDYYITKTELVRNKKELESLIYEAAENYRELIQLELTQGLSRPVAKAVQYINQNLYGPCTVSDVAAAAGVHPVYLAELFKKELHDVPSRYIMKLKIEESKELLSEMKLSVTQTAETFGFSGVAHFSAVFKAHTGKSPSRYTYLQDKDVRRRI